MGYIDKTALSKFTSAVQPLRFRNETVVSASVLLTRLGAELARRTTRTRVWVLEGIEPIQCVNLNARN